MPWMLLIGPGIALLSLLIRMFVAIGYAITGNFAVLPRDGSEPAVGVYALSGPQADRSELRIELASGEVFIGDYEPASSQTALELLADTVAAGASDTDTWPEPNGRSAAGRAILASDLGRTMRCEFGYDRTSETGFGICNGPGGEIFDVVLSSVVPTTG